MFVIVIKSVEVINLILVGFLFTSHLSSKSVDNFFLFFSKFSGLVSKLFTAVFEFLDATLHFVLLLLGHQGFTHTISN